MTLRFVKYISLRVILLGDQPNRDVIENFKPSYP
jgi:hypothetical protein